MSYNFFFDCLFILEFMYTFIRKVNSSSVHVTKKNLASDLSWKTFCVLKSSQNRDWQPIYTRVSAITMISLVSETRENCEDWQRQKRDCSPSRGHREPDDGCLRRVRPWVKSHRSPFQKPLSWGREKKERHKIHWFYSLLICIIKKLQTFSYIYKNVFHGKSSDLLCI